MIHDFIHDPIHDFNTWFQYIIILHDPSKWWKKKSSSWLQIAPFPKSKGPAVWITKETSSHPSAIQSQSSTQWMNPTQTRQRQDKLSNWPCSNCHPLWFLCQISPQVLTAFIPIHSRSVFRSWRTSLQGNLSSQNTSFLFFSFFRFPFLHLKDFGE